MKNRRKHFLIDKPLQIRYLLYITLTLILISAAIVAGSYYGIWGFVIKTFSEESLHQTLITAAQINEYEQARHPSEKPAPNLPTLRLFRETALLSTRQQEMIQEIMKETNRRLLILGAFLIVFIGWGSIFLTHKIAGPLFQLRHRFQELEEGNLTTRTQLRKFDETHPLAENFNAMAASLDARIGKLKRLARETNDVSLKKELNHFKTSAD